MRVLCFDIGGTAIKYALLNENDDFNNLNVKTIETRITGKENFILEDICKIIEKFKNKIDAVAVSSAGVVDSVKGEIIFAGPTIPGYTNTKIKETIEKNFSKPCFVENDVNCAAIGEYSYSKYSGSAFCLTIGTGWSLAVVMGAYFAGNVSGAHLNPAITIGMLAIHKISLTMAIQYVIAQFLGAMLGQLLVVAYYKKHYDETTDKGLILATFATGPAIKSPFWNMVSEIIATFMLVFGVLFLINANLGSLTIFFIGLLVFSIGLSIGGATGYPINPARDLGPRIIHAILPLKNKGDSDWSYALIPVVGPIIGGVLGALVFSVL